MPLCMPKWSSRLMRHYACRSNMGKRLMRLVKNPTKLDKIFIPRGVAPKPTKRPSPPVLNPYPVCMNLNP